jgi:hypothetical protein
MLAHSKFPSNVIYSGRKLSDIGEKICCTALAFKFYFSGSTNVTVRVFVVLLNNAGGLL